MPIRFFRDLALALASLVLLAASWSAYRVDQRDRLAYEEFIARFELERRRPDDVATLRLQPQADLSAVITSAMALEDVYGTVRLTDLDDATRDSWLRSVRLVPAEIDAAIELALGAVAVRPGWAFHPSMLAQLAYTKSRREAPAAVARDIDRWELPSLLAISLAPGNDAVRAFLGGAYLEIWQRGTTRQPPLVALRAAMRSARFVERNFGVVATLAGRFAAIELLPDDAPVLRIALAREMREGRIDEAVAIRARLDGVIRASRAAGLERIETLAARRDRYGLQLTIPAWLAANRLEELDTPAARREAGRVAELWPAMRRSAWPNDQRAVLLRYFLDGREASADGAALARLAGSLSGLPDPVAARALAIGGEPRAAQQLLFSSQSRGAFEWTSAVVEMARAFLRNGDAGSARKILGELAPNARDECGSLLVSRDAAPDAASRDAITRRVAAMTAAPIPESAWSASGTLALCIDPSALRRSVLHVSLDARSPALVSWGWDGGRAGSVVVRGQATIAVPLEGLEGRRVLRVHADAGGPVTLGEARTE